MSCRCSRLDTKGLADASEKTWDERDWSSSYNTHLPLPRYTKALWLGEAYNDVHHSQVYTLQSFNAYYGLKR